MSGKIDVCVRKGRSKDPRYENYCEWYLEVEGEDGLKTKLSPPFSEMRRIIKEILIHEYRNDATRFRRPDFMKKMKMLMMSDQLFAEAQIDFEAYDVPEIYLTVNTTKDGRQKWKIVDD
jgi:hypothetical protein